MNKPVSILGSGMAGMGAAHKLRELGIDSVMYDKNPYLGGHTASHTYPQGFTFDEGPHISFTKDDRMQKLLAQNIDNDYQVMKAYVNNYWHGYWVKHPAQCNLFGLPQDVIVSVLKDFIDAQYKEHGEINNYKDWLYASYGETFAERFPMKYTRKYHTTDAENLSTDWLGPRLYRPAMDEILQGALSPDTADVHYITDFRYPTHGGFVSYLKPFARNTHLQLEHELKLIDTKNQMLYFANGSTEAYSAIVSSIPLPEIVPMIKGTPADILDAAAKLACSQVVVVNLGINRENVHDAFWTYFYDEDIIISRLSTPYKQSPNNVPSGCSSLQAECYFSDKYKPLQQTPEACAQQVVDDLVRVGVLKEPEEVVMRDAIFVPYANVIFDHDRNQALETVHGYLDDIGIAYCGRYGDWAYIWTDESFVSGERAAERISQRF